MTFPIVCMTDGHRFTVEKVTADLVCTACGSDDCDFDDDAVTASVKTGTLEQCKFCEKPPVITARWMSSDGNSVIETGYYCQEHRESARNWSGDVEISRVGSKAKGPSVKTASAVAFCSDCFKAKYGYEPDMGDDGSTFEPGTCSNCGRSQTVFTPSDDLLAATSAKQAAFETDPEMGKVEETTQVKQKVTCSTCLTDHEVTAVDPAQPMPLCPSCGAPTLSPAGGTLASRKTASDGVEWAANSPSLLPADHPARFGYSPTGETTTEPCDTCGAPVTFEWYENASSRALAPVEPGAGSDYMATWCPAHVPSRRKSSKTATFYCTKHDVYVGDGNRDTHAGEGCKIEQRKSEESKEGSLDGVFASLVAEAGSFRDMMSDYETKVTRTASCRYCKKAIEERGGIWYAGKEPGADFCPGAPNHAPSGSPKKAGSLDAAFASLQSEAGPNDGMSPSGLILDAIEDTFAGVCRECGQMLFDHIVHVHNGPLSGPGVQYAAKIAEIEAGVRKTNPGMDQATARRVAVATVRRYPTIVGKGI